VSRLVSRYYGGSTLLPAARLVAVVLFCLSVPLHAVSAQEAESLQKAHVVKLYKNLSKIQKEKGRAAADRAFAALNQADQLKLKAAMRNIRVTITLKGRVSNGHPRDLQRIERRNTASSPSSPQAASSCFGPKTATFTGEMLGYVDAFHYSQVINWCGESFPSCNDYDSCGRLTSEPQCHPDFTELGYGFEITYEAKCQESGGKDYNLVRYTTYARIENVANFVFNPHISQQGEYDGRYFCYIDGQECEDNSTLVSPH